MPRRPKRKRATKQGPSVITVTFQDVSAQCIVRRDFEDIRKHREDTQSSHASSGASDMELRPAGQQYRTEIYLPCSLSRYNELLQELRQRLYPGSIHTDGSTRRLGMRYTMCHWRGVPVMLTDTILSMIVEQAISDETHEELTVLVYNDSPQTNIPFSAASLKQARAVYEALGIDYVPDCEFQDFVDPQIFDQFLTYLRTIGAALDRNAAGFRWSHESEAAQFARSGAYLQKVLPINSLVARMAGPAHTLFRGNWKTSENDVKICDVISNTSYSGRADYLYQKCARRIILTVKLETGRGNFQMAQSELEAAAYNVHSEQPVIHLATDLNETWHVFVLEKKLTGLKCSHMKLDAERAKVLTLFYCLQSLFSSRESSSCLIREHQQWFRKHNDADGPDEGDEALGRDNIIHRRARPSDFKAARAAMRQLPNQDGSEDSSYSGRPRRTQEELQRLVDEEIEDYIAKNLILYEDQFENEDEMREFLRKRFIINIYANQIAAADAGLSIKEYYRKQEAEAELEQDKRAMSGISAREDFMRDWQAGNLG